MPGDEPSAEGPARVSLTDSSGVVVGDNAVQYNTTHYHAPTPQYRLVTSRRGRQGPQLDAAALPALSPHVVAPQIRRMDHDDAAFLLASASFEHVTAVLRILIQTDEALVVALLADVHPSKAAQLIAPHAQAVPWLAHLPAAVEDIAQEALRQQWQGDGPRKPLQRVRSSTGTEGYVRRYAIKRHQDTVIYWQQGHGLTAVATPIADCYDAEGGPSGPLGLPIEPLYGGRSSFSTDGRWQRFERGSIYSSAHGVYSVIGALVDAYRKTDGQRGYLGFPTAAPRSIQAGMVQDFEGGAIYDCGLSSAVPVRADVEQALELGYDFVPTGPESGALPSPDGTMGQMQVFRSDAVTTSTVYSSKAWGTYAIPPEFVSHYDSLGGTKSWLGFPVAHNDLMTGAIYQKFEGGGMLLLQNTQTFILVSSEIFGLLTETPGLLERLGEPLSEEEPAGHAGADRVCYFENGVITRRDGEAAAWFRS